MKNPREVSVFNEGYSFTVPNYVVTENGVEDFDTTDILFCRGDKNNKEVPRQKGVFVESLLEIVIQRLKTVNVGDLATRETSISITKIEEAIMWLEKRSNDRKLRGVQGTYQK